MGSRQFSELRSIPSNRKTNGAAVATSDFVETGAYGEWRVVLHGQDSSFPGRLCAVRKERPLDSTGPPTIGAQVTQEANQH